MTTKHTPGRWRSSSMTMSKADWAALHSGKHPIEVVLRGHDVIAVVWCGDDRDGEEKANAHLIAAAPDLHEKGSALVSRDCRYEGGNIVIPCGSHAEALRIMSEFRAAISKAEGRA